MCDNPPVRTPNFLVGGVARAGTTAVVAGLSRHPRVAVTSPKEPHYFALHDTVPAFTAPGDDVMINNSAITTEADYLALFPAGNFEASGDGSTSSSHVLVFLPCTLYVLSYIFSLSSILCVFFPTPFSSFSIIPLTLFTFLHIPRCLFLLFSFFYF